MFDKNGRRINYLRVSLTDRCNLRCIYCMPEAGVEKKCHENILRFEEIIRIVQASSKLGITKVRYTGGEPLILKNIEQLIYDTSKISGIEDISITTNGMLLYEKADELKKAGLKRANISLDTLKEDKFKLLTRGGELKKVTSAIEKCLSIGIAPIKINTVLLKGINDDEIDDLIYLTKDMPINIRFIELMPIGEGEKLYADHFMSNDEVIEGQEGLIPLKNKDGSTAKLYRKKGYNGTVGFISPLSCKFCSSCNRIRLTAQGTIKPCLHSEGEISIKEFINDDLKLIKALKEAIYNKPAEHKLNEEGKSETHRSMYEIGG